MHLYGPAMSAPDLALCILRGSVSKWTMTHTYKVLHLSAFRNMSQRNY